MKIKTGGENVSNGSATLFAVVLSVCFVAGGVSGVAVAVMIEGPETIDIPEGTLIVPENGEPYYYFENGIVITNQVFEVAIDNYENFVIVWPENYVPSSDNFVIVFRGWQDNYIIMPTDNIFNVYPIRPVYITVGPLEDLEWREHHDWLEIEGQLEYISVRWPEEYYEYSIQLIPTLGFDNWLRFSLRRGG